MTKPDNLDENGDGGNGDKMSTNATEQNDFVDGDVTSTEITTIANGNKKSTNSADVSLPNDVLERLYQRYSIKQRRAGLECFLATSVLFDLWTIFAPHQINGWESLSE